MHDHVVVHYSEISTKSGNRRRFEDKLGLSVERLLRPFATVDVRRESGRMTFALSPVPEERRADALAAIARLPGVSWTSPSRRTLPTLEALCETTVALARRRTGSFKIEARRSDKSLPFDSRRIAVDVGSAVQQATGRRVDVHAPDDVYRIEVDRRIAHVLDARIRGPGGLPVGSAGRVVALLSGGIDSPVAAWRTMVRGCEVVGVHLWNRSFSGEGVKEKVLDLAQALARHQGAFRLVVIPFDAIQREIVAAAPSDVRMLLYRRAMLRVAGEVRRASGAEGIVVGDSISQVASQTLPNLAAVWDAAEAPVLAPLCGTCKEQTISEAQRIGTYGISIRPGADCCGLLVARHPKTSSTACELRTLESRYDLPGLVAAAAAERETFDFHALGDGPLRDRTPA